MKKAISLLLACLIAFSSLSFASFAQDDSLIDKVTGTFDFDDMLSDFDSSSSIVPDEYLGDTADIEQLIESGAINDANLFGLDVKFLYTSNLPLIWSTLSVSKTDLTMVKTNLNVYLARLYESKFGEAGSTKLFTAENANLLINFIGHLLNPNFADVTLKGDTYSTDMDFYTAVVTHSGLRDIINNYWCADYSLNYRPFLYTLGFDFDDEEMLGDSKIRNADRVSRTLVRSVLKRINQQGPLNYLLTLISNIAKTYSSYMYEPIKALFTLQINAGVISEDELKTLKGLFNMMINHNDEFDTEHLQMITPPSYRFALATSFDGNSQSTDTTEMFLYMLVYLNLVGQYRVERTGSFPKEDGEGGYVIDNDGNVVMENRTVKIDNAEAIVNIKNSVMSSNLEDIDKIRLNSIVDSLFYGNFTELLSLMNDIAKENISSELTSPGNAIYSILANIIKVFADFLNKIVDSLRNFGKF